MPIDLAQLKPFVDLGGVFILSLLILYFGYRQLQSIDDKLDRMLALLAILVKTSTNFNGVDHVLGKSGEDVANIILEAEKSHTQNQ